MHFKFKLLQKALVLILVPLGFSIAFMLHMFNLVTEADKQVALHLQASRVLAAGEKFVLGNMLADVTCLTYVAFHRKESAAAHALAAHQMVESLLELRGLLASRPDTMSALRVQIKRIAGDLDNQKIVMMLPPNVVLSTVLKHDTYQVQQELKDMAGGGLLATVLDTDKRNDVAALAQWHTVQSQIEFTLLAGLTTSTLLTLALGLYFYRNIIQRMRNVQQNILRINSKSDLSRPLGGSDEIAVLDVEVHETARRIHEIETYKNRLTAFVGHQLNTPLNAIAASIDNLEKADNLDANALNTAQRAQVSLSRLKRMSAELLNMDKIEDSVIHLNIESVALGPLIQHACEAVELAARDKQITIQQRVTAATLDTDRDRLIQVLVNLLSNAIKFSASGSTVIITATNDQDRVRLSVIDHGRGIPDEFRDQLFSRFAQVEAADAADHKGFGLGLSICKSIVDAHGGTISIDSQVGSGTTFHIAIPATQNSKAISDTIPAGKRSTRSLVDRLLADTRMWQKGAALIALPLVLQFMLIAGMSSILATSAALVELSAHQRKETALATVASRTAMQVLMLAASYHIRQIPAIKQAFYEYNNRLTGDLDAYSSLGGFKAKRFVDGVHRGQRIGVALVNSAGQDVPAQAVMANAAEAADFEAIALRANDSLNDLRNAERELELHHAIELQQSRTQLYQLMLTSLTINILLAIAFGYMTWRGICLRTAKVIANSHNLLTGAKLTPPTDDRDEIGDIDRALYASGMKLLQLQEYKRELVSVVGHDLRSPLTTVLGTIEMFAEGIMGTLSEESRKAVIEAGEESRQLIHLINELLDVEKSKLQTELKLEAADRMLTVTD